MVFEFSIDFNSSSREIRIVQIIGFEKAIETHIIVVLHSLESIIVRKIIGSYIQILMFQTYTNCKFIYQDRLKIKLVDELMELLGQMNVWIIWVEIANL